MKVVPHLKGDFNSLRRHSDSKIIPQQIPIALYQTKRMDLGEGQYQMNNPTKPYIIRLQVLNS